MSYILDALRKSEQERGHGNIPSVQTVHSSSINYHKDKRPAWPWFLGAFIIINLVAVIYYFQTQETIEPVAETKPVDTEETTIAVTAPIPAPAPKPVQPAVQQPAVQPQTATAAVSEPKETNVASRSIPAEEDNTVYTEQPVSAAEPVQPPPAVQPAQQAKPVEAIFETVDINDLPSNVRQHIPEMNFSAHVYSTNPSLRSIVINGRFMEEGSPVNNDLTLTEITTTGAIFDFQGYRFSTSVTPGWQ